MDLGVLVLVFPATESVQDVVKRSFERIIDL